MRGRLRVRLAGERLVRAHEAEMGKRHTREEHSDYGEDGVVEEDAQAIPRRAGATTEGPRQDPGREGWRASCRWSETPGQ